MGEHRLNVLGRFAPINQEGDCIELDSVVYGQYVDIVLLRKAPKYHVRPCEHEPMGDTHSNMRE